MAKKKMESEVKNSDKPKSKLAGNKEFEFFEHTADVKFRAYGKNFAEALANAGKATMQVMTDIKKIKPVQKKQINVTSKTKESLIYDFLEELIFLVDTEGFLAKNIKIKIRKQNATNNATHKDKNKKDKQLSTYSLTATIEGDNAKKYDIHTQIKAVTYNDMIIEETKDRCSIQIVHDI